jgi:hypothetical protein
MICQNRYLRLNFERLHIELDRPDHPEDRKKMDECLEKLDAYLRGHLKHKQLEDYLSSEHPKQEEKLWRGSLSMNQLSLLRAQMRNDLQIFGPTYTKPTDLDKAFLDTADVTLWRAPWRRPLRTPWRLRNSPIMPPIQRSKLKAERSARPIGLRTINSTRQALAICWRSARSRARRADPPTGTRRRRHRGRTCPGASHEGPW